MDSFMKADIFFVVTTVAVVALTIVIGVAGGYAIVIMRDVQRLTRRAREEGEEILADVGELRQEIKRTRSPVRSIVKFFLSFIK